MLSVMLNKQIDDYKQYIVGYYNDDEQPYTTGIKISASNVYSVCPGRVISVRWSFESKWTVTVLVNSNQIVRYCNLQDGKVREGQMIDFRTYIGEASSFVRFEYCTSDKGNSMWPVRIKSLTMYKQDPLGLLTGDIKLSVSLNNVHKARGDEPMIPLDKHTLAEFIGNRGDE